MENDRILRTRNTSQAVQRFRTCGGVPENYIYMYRILYRESISCILVYIYIYIRF